MKLHSQYIILYLSKIFLLSVTVLTTVVILIQFLGLVNYYQDLNVSIYNIVIFVLLAFPGIFVWISPVAVGCAILYVFHVLTTDNEIVVLESSGLSKFSLALSGLTFASAVAVVCYSVVMVIEPLAKRELHLRKDRMINKMFSAVSEDKPFNKISTNVMLYINKRDQNNDLEGIILFDNSVAGKEIIICAEKASILHNGDFITIVLQNGSRQEVGENTLHVIKFNTLSLPLHPGRNHASRDKALFTSDHYVNQQFIFQLIKNFNKSLQARNELHYRISYPLCNLVIGCISLAAVLYGEHSRRWRIRKIWNAFILISLAMMFIFALKNKAASHVAYAVSLYLCIFAFIGYSLYRLKLSSENRI